MSDDPRVVVARVVLPVADAATVLPLYLDAAPSSGQREADAATDGIEIIDRRSVRIAAGRTASFGTYFNHFPAAYWAAWTGVASVVLTVRTSGTGGIRVLRSDADATPVVVSEATADGDSSFTLPVAEVSAGAYWFELTGGEGPLVLHSADWSAPAEALAPLSTATAGMATFNRPVDCLAQLHALAADDEVVALLDRIVVVDQGSQHVEDLAGYPAAAHALGSRLVMIRQPNLGGSGGFSRVMLESLERQESESTILLDDDAITEPESLLRAIRFEDAARAAGGAVIVGGGMLHLDDRTRIYAQSEVWNPRIGWVDLSRTEAYDHDFAAEPFSTSPYWHRVHRSDFNGWWFSLLPNALLRDGGLAMPMFLKGDDVEFGRRAQSRGVPTVSLPGVAVWHLGWGGKAPTRTWEAYFLHRNRIIGELLHAVKRRPTRIILHSLLGDLKPLLQLQYSGVRLRALALEDVFEGPDRLPALLPIRTAEVRELWSRFPDATPVDPAIPTLGEDVVRAPAARVAAAALLAFTWARHLVVAASARSRRRPATRVESAALDWATFAHIDSAVVDTPDGAGATWYLRSRSETRRALIRSIRLHARLWQAWPALSRRYRDAAAALTSAQAWSRVFEEAG